MAMATHSTGSDKQILATTIYVLSTNNNASIFSRARGRPATLSELDYLTVHTTTNWEVHSLTVHTVCVVCSVEISCLRSPSPSSSKLPSFSLSHWPCCSLSQSKGSSNSRGQATRSARADERRRLSGCPLIRRDRILVKEIIL